MPGRLATVLLLVGVGLAAWAIGQAIVEGFAAQGVRFGFTFLDRQAGFTLGESLIAVGPGDSYARALLAGFLNTVKVAVPALVLATVLGTVVGLARLSTNWLVAQLAGSAVELVRNTPLLLQLVVWHAAITWSLPVPADSEALGPGIHVTNRGIYLPWVDHPVAWAWVGAAGLAGFLVCGWPSIARRLGPLSGVTRWVLRGLAAGLCAGAVWWAVGAPWGWDRPVLSSTNLVGGLALTPEFLALWLGLSVYGGAFIAEVVRGGVLSVPSAQRDAARALGMRPAAVGARVVAPLALRGSVPPLTNEYVNIVKNSALGVAIGYPDLISVSNTMLSQTGRAIEAVSIYAAVYLMLSLSIAAGMGWLNRRSRVAV